MPSLLDAIHQRQESAEEPVYVLEIPEDEYAAFLETGECLWVEDGPPSERRYRHLKTGQIYTWGEPIKFPGDSTVYYPPVLGEQPREPEPSQYLIIPV